MKSANVSYADLRELRAVRVLERAVSASRLGQAILLHGGSLPALQAVATQLAAALLRVPPAALSHHPDVFSLQPRGKSRQITIGTEAERSAGAWPPNTMRRFLHDLHLSSSQGDRKIGLVLEADRMNVQTSNAFLKTLEEPPPGTTLFLLTTRPYDLLETIRSRCLNFRVPASLDAPQDPAWLAWIEDYRRWLALVSTGPTDRALVAESVLAAYGFVARFETILAALAATAWKDASGNLPDTLTEDETSALETGLARGVRQVLLAGLAEATRDFGLHAGVAGASATLPTHPLPGAGGLPESSPIFPRRLARAIEKLESVAYLMERLNLNEATALEAFFLASLRIWSNRD